MQSPAVFYSTPAGRVTPSRRTAAVVALMEGVRVSLPPPMPASFPWGAVLVGEE